MSIPALHLSGNPLEQRRDKRWLVRLGAAIYGKDAQQHRLTILDLSADGFLMETPRSLPPNACLVVEMPCGTHKMCKTVWNEGHRHGAVLSDPLTDAELESLVATNVVAYLPTRDTPANRPELSQTPFKGSAESESEHEGKYPLAIRMLIAIGASAGLWGMIGFAFWQAATLSH